MRIFKSITTLILITLLAACNVTPSTSSSTSGISSAVNISSIEIATSSSLTQFIGLTSKITVNASLNSGAALNTPIEWYVNNEKSLTQNGLSFEFLPTEVKTYQLQAKVGNTSSNILSVVVGLPRFNLISVEAIANNQITVRTDTGVSFAISGLSIASSSSYNLATQTYTLNLISPMIQGNTYNITASKPGFENIVFPLLYETRKLTIGSIIYRGQRVNANADGAYEIQKPFAGAPSQNYTLSLVQTNLEGSAVPVSIITNVPAGATAVAPFQTALVIQRGINITRDYTLTNTTEPGVYIHNVTVNNVSLVIRIVVSNPTPSFALTTPIVFDVAASNVGGSALSAPFALNAEGNTIKKTITPNAAGQYVITRPYNGSAFELTFILTADNFPTPLGFPSGANPYNIIAALSGPSGGVMYYGSTVNALTTSYPFRETTGNSYRVSQYIDNKTSVGTYTYSFTAAGYNLNISRNIVVVVREFEPTIEPVITYGGQTLKANSDGSFTIFKPLATNTLNMGINVKISNYESPLASSFVGGSGLTTLYSDGSALRYLLDTRMSYSGPLSSVTPLVTKMAIELGSSSTDTVVTAQNGSVNFNRYFGTAASKTIDLVAIHDTATYTDASGTNIFDAMKTITATTFPGLHTYTVEIGPLSRTFIFRVVESAPLITIRANVVQYGPNGSESENNVTYKEDEDRYYVNGKGGDLKINILPFGMATGDYPYTFTRFTPSGTFQSSTNAVTLTLKTGGSYDGTLDLPASGAGSEMKVDEPLTEEGEYVYTFIINGITRVIRVVVLSAPQLRVDGLTFNDIAVREFNNRYFVNHSTSSRYLEVDLTAINIENTYKYILNDTGVLPVGSALTSALQELVIINGKMIVGITVPSSSANTEVVNTYLIALYKGSVQIGAISKIVVVSQPLSSTIFFASNGGTTVAPKNQFVATNVSAPTPPTRTGFDFVSWHLNPNLSDAAVNFSSYTMPSADTVIYAKWIQYTITYNLDGGTLPSGALTTFSSGQLPYTLPAPTKTGSTFTGWFAAASGGSAITTINSGTTTNQTFFARWTTP